MTAKIKEKCKTLKQYELFGMVFPFLLSFLVVPKSSAPSSPLSHRDVALLLVLRQEKDPGQSRAI